MIDWRNTYHLGYCFGTILMRASSNKFYPSSISKLLYKSRFYLVTIGDEEEEENFWIHGREIMTLYATQQGFKQVFLSALEKQIMDIIDEADFEELYEHYGSAHGDNEFRSLEENYHNPDLDPEGETFSFIRDPKVYQCYKSLDEVKDSIKSLGRKVTVYRIHTETKPYYLEEI